MRTSLFILTLLASPIVLATFSDTLNLPDMTIASDGITENLGEIVTPFNCKEGSFSFMIEVERQTGVGDLIFSIVDSNNNRFDFYGGEKQRFSHLPRTVKFVNFNHGEYDSRCKCIKNPGPRANIKITQRELHLHTDDKYCSVKFSGNFSTYNRWLHSGAFGTSLKGITAQIRQFQTIQSNFEVSECNQIWLEDANKQVLPIVRSGEVSVVTFPIRYFEKPSCISPRKNKSEGNDYSLSLQIEGVQNENN